MRSEPIIGDAFTVFWGLDNFTGPFVQVWRNPHDAQDCALIIIDNQGVQVEPDEAEPRWKPAFGSIIASFENRFQFAASRGNPRPNLSPQDIGLVAKAAGCEVDVLEIYRALD